MTVPMREMLPPGESGPKMEHPEGPAENCKANNDGAAGDVRKLSELYKELIERRRERRDANALYRKRARDNNILVATASVFTFVIIAVALMAEPGPYRLLGIAAWMIFLVTYAWLIWDPISLPDDPLTKQYFHSLNIEIWEIEREIKEIEWKYKKEGSE